MDSSNESKSSAKSSSMKQKVVVSQDEMNFADDPAKKTSTPKQKMNKSRRAAKSKMDKTNESKSSAKSPSKQPKVVVSQVESNFADDQAKQTPKETPKKYKKKGKKPKSKNKANSLKMKKHSRKMNESAVPEKPLDALDYYYWMSFRIVCGVIAAISVILAIVYYFLYHC